MIPPIILAVAEAGHNPAFSGKAYTTFAVIAGILLSLRFAADFLLPSRRSRRRQKREYQKDHSRHSHVPFQNTAAQTVHAVTTPPLANVAPTQWSLESLQRLEWKRFETVCRAFLESLGYDAKETRVGADGGVDINVYHRGNDKPSAVAQCKAWHSYRVGVKPIRELFGVMASEGVQNGLFLTTSAFTDEARDFAKYKPLQLVDGTELIGFIHQLQEDKQALLFNVAFDEGFDVPTCPNCDVKMVRRVAGKGANVGQEFWGCPRYPKCRRTFQMTQTE